MYMQTRRILDVEVISTSWLWCIFVHLQSENMVWHQEELVEATADPSVAKKDAKTKSSSGNDTWLDVSKVNIIDVSQSQLPLRERAGQ